MPIGTGTLSRWQVLRKGNNAGNIAWSRTDPGDQRAGVICQPQVRGGGLIWEAITKQQKSPVSAVRDDNLSDEAETGPGLRPGAGA